MLSEKRDHVGRKYAVLGWSYARAQSETDLAKARKHAIEGFIIADTAIDGKRDFTDRQVAVYVDSTTPEAW